MDDPIRVIYVDNDPHTVELAVNRLEGNGHVSVETATSVEDGLDRLDAVDFDCVVSDYEMPERDGLHFLRAVRETRPDLPFVLFSERSGGIITDAIAAGVTQYVTKGNDAEQWQTLDEVIERAAEEYRSGPQSTEQTQILQTVLDNVPIALWTLDDTGTFTRSEGRALERVGVGDSDVVGDSIFDRFADTQPVIDGYESALDGESVATDITIGRTVFQSWFEPLRIDGSDVTGVVVLAVDVTEQRERERELQRQNRQLEEFANIVSHDIRNPLQVARAQLDEAERTGSADAFEKTREAQNRIETIVDDVLTLARQGQSLEDTSRVDLDVIARDAWKTVDTSQITLSVVGDVQIEAAAPRLRQLLENLFRNSAEHSDSPVTVTVGPLTPLATTRIGRDTADGFYVEDDGSGIPEDQREEIFEPGFSTATDGTGFGLAIVKQIADVHGWETRVTDSHDGGARFEFVERER